MVETEIKGDGRVKGTSPTNSMGMVDGVGAVNSAVNGLVKCADTDAYIERSVKSLTDLSTTVVIENEGAVAIEIEDTFEIKGIGATEGMKAVVFDGMGSLDTMRKL